MAGEANQTTTILDELPKKYRMRHNAATLQHAILGRAKLLLKELQ